MLDWDYLPKDSHTWRESEPTIVISDATNAILTIKKPLSVSDSCMIIATYGNKILLLLLLTKSNSIYDSYFIKQSMLSRLAVINIVLHLKQLASDCL